MELIELVKYFRIGGTYEKFCQDRSLNLKSEVVEIYMQKPFSIDNDLAFFEIESTEGMVEYNFNGITYYNLFDFYYFLDVIAESKEEQNINITDEELARRLYNYALKDA